MPEDTGHPFDDGGVLKRGFRGEEPGDAAHSLNSA
jgi:hypothetical protein